MANIKVLLYDQADAEYDVSYIEEIPLSLSFLIADVKNPEKRNTTFSKTINFNSKDVDLFFRVIWKLNSSLTTFDPRLKCRIKYYVNEVLQLDGDIQLIKVIVDPDSKQVTYQTTATGTIGNLFLSIGDAYLTALDFSAYDHSLTKANITNSWVATAGTGYYYGLINWGQNQINSETEYHVKHFRPQFYKREYMAKIFAAAGYTWTSVYLDSTYYKNQLIPPTTEVLKLGTTAIANSQFYARRNANQLGTADSFTYSPTAGWILNTGTKDVVLFNEDNVLPYNDAGAQYTTGTGEFTVANSNVYNLSTYIDFDFTISNTVGTATKTTINSGRITAQLQKWNGASWSIVSATQSTYINAVYLSLVISNNVFVTLPNVSLVAGEKYRVVCFPFNLQFDLSTALNVPVITGTTSTRLTFKTNSTYYATLASDEMIEGGTLEVNQCIPADVKQIDWLMTEVKESNLYMIPNPDKENDYIIEPRDEGFYNGEDDWSEILDFDRKFEVLPVSELDTKRYEFLNKQDSDEFNDKYFKQYKETYGFGYTDCVSDFVRPTKKTELIYAPTPLVDNNINGLIIPKIYKNDNGTIKPMKSVIRQLYRGGNINLSYGTWTLKSSLSGDTTYSYYPFVGEVDNPYFPTLSLNWDTPKKVYYKYINATYTNNNLKNKYYSKMINQLTDKRSAVVKAYFNLNELRVKDFSFRKVVWVQHFNSYFYIENFEYIMNTQQSTLVTMLKLQEYDTWAGTNIDVPDPEPSELNRIINGNSSNGTNNTNNGTASRISGGSGNFIETGAQSVQLENCVNVVINGDVSNFRGVGLSNMVITSALNNTTLNAADEPIVITEDTTLDSTYHGKKLLINSALSVELMWDAANMQGVEVEIVNINTGSVTLNDVDAVVTVIGNAVPYNLGLARYDAVKVTSYTDDIYYLGNYAPSGGGGSGLSQSEVLKITSFRI